ncbi:hypothetical protein LSAT2_022907 [Lamellibrachia satsuma]|nr:hypothetical protein LSAT2_022907 [Lamellibrachia satsuma]
MPHSLFNNKTVYLKISKLGVTDFIYLYYDDTAARWTFARDVEGINTLGHTTGGQTAPADPVDVTTTWTFVTNGSVMNDVHLTMTCDISLVSPPPIQKLATSPAPTNLSLQQLYKDGAHQRNDMIEECTWKGQPCDPNYFRSRFTDSGLCLTFEPPSTTVERAGQGSALKMSFNVEKYEYTKDTLSGIGIQVLFHDRRDEPIMKEKSFLLSAGLYSLVAVEKTTVQNAEPPWGTCGRKELNYYDFYSVATCRMDCANTLVRDGCECRALNMPNVTQDYDVCGIDKHVDCAAPTLEEFRKYGNFCMCTAPCKEDLFVTSVSFSYTNVNLDRISGAAKVKMGKLQSRLETAREITFRHTTMIINKSRPILDRSPPGLTMTASFTTHQGGHETFTTGRTTISKIRGRDNIAIASWNVRTLRPIGNLKELTHEMERYNWHLLGICEQRWKNCRKRTPKKDTVL